MTATTHRYTRRNRIATGGMGEVGLAHDEVLHRDVAVKYLKKEFADDEGSRTRFLQEARAAAFLAETPAGGLPAWRAVFRPRVVL